MMGVRAVAGIAVPFDEPGIDTDQIIPGRFLLKPRSFDYGPLLFHDRRFGPSAEPGFILDDPAYRGARIIVAAQNFGIGSSREQAPWALKDFGILAVVAPSFGDIFRINCVKNGLVPAEVTGEAAAGLRADLHARKGAEVLVDLERLTVETAGLPPIPFTIDPASRDQLLSGADDIARSLRHEGAVDAFERAARTETPWSLPRTDGA